MNAPPLYIILAIIASLFFSVGPFYFKKATATIKNFKSVIFNKYLYLGIMFYALGTILSLSAYYGADFSVIYPIFALSYVWSLFLSKWFLGERINAWKWAAVGAIVLGVFLIAI